MLGLVLANGVVAGGMIAVGFLRDPFGGGHHASRLRSAIAAPIGGEDGAWLRALAARRPALALPELGSRSGTGRG